MLRYWYNEDEHEYDSSMSEPEAESFVRRGYREIDRIEFDEAMRGLK